MTKIRIAYVQEFIDRHGIVRRYFRRAGCKAVMLPGAPGSPEFNAAYERALAGVPKPVTETQGSIAALIAAYYKSEAFTKALAPDTRQQRRNIRGVRDCHPAQQAEQRRKAPGAVFV